MMKYEKCKNCAYENIISHATPCGKCGCSGTYYVRKADLPPVKIYRATKDIYETQKKEVIKKLNTWYVNVGKATELTEEIFKILGIEEI